MARDTKMSVSIDCRVFCSLSFFFLSFFYRPNNSGRKIGKLRGLGDRTQSSRINISSLNVEKIEAPNESYSSPKTPAVNLCRTQIFQTAFIFFSFQVDKVKTNEKSWESEKFLYKLEINRSNGPGTLRSVKYAFIILT